MKKIIESLKKAFSLIKKHRNLIALLFILQFVFFVVMFYVNINYQLKIMENAQAIVEFLDKQELTDEDIAGDLLSQEDLLKDSFVLFNAYKEITKNVIMLVVLSFVIFVLFGGFLWALTYQLINKKKLKEFLKYIGKFAVITIVYGVIGFVIITQLVATFQENFAFNYFWIILFLLLFYFIFISYTLIGKLKIKELAKQTFLIGVKKAHYILLVYLVNIIIIALFGFLAQLFLESQILLLTLALILLVFSFVWARLFLILVVDRLI